MKTKRIGIIMHGVTGRMGMNQHLIRSVLAIRNQGGIALADGSQLMPDPIIVGRNASKVATLARKLGVERVSDDIDAALANPDDTIFFDAASTQLRQVCCAKQLMQASMFIQKSQFQKAWKMLSPLRAMRKKRALKWYRA